MTGLAGRHDPFARERRHTLSNTTAEGRGVVEATAIDVADGTWSEVPFTVGSLVSWQRTYMEP